MLEQHEFLSGRSTTTCNFVSIPYIYDAFRMHSQVNVIYMDFIKAFNKVDHSLFINSLNFLGIENSLLSWLCSYLTDRVQFVSILGSSLNVLFPPLVFLKVQSCYNLFLFFFVNSVTSVLINTKFLIFADDMKPYLRIKSLSGAG